jgi:hypothetical protein
MSVEFISAAHVRDLTKRIEQARQSAIDDFGVPPQSPDARYWEPLFEANAARVLAVVSTVSLPGDLVVRYRFYRQRGGDLLVRPFVARSGTDVASVRRLLDWHAPPDSAAGVAHTQDVELLYRHFSFAPSAVGYFEYWLLLQELWASARWAHSHLIASADELSQITAGEGWQVLHPVESYEPAVVVGDRGARLAILLQCPLRRFEITLQQIDVGADQSVRYGEPILVASGPRGYVL